MNLRRRGNPDSLELLLNTMCNTFGGIVMISLVMALLSKDTASEAAATEIQRLQHGRLEQVETDLRAARDLQSRLVQSDPALEKVLQLMRERDELRNHIAADKAAIETSSLAAVASTSTNDPAKTEQLLAHLASETNQVRVLTERLERLKQSRQRPLRLPREHATGKKPFYFVLKSGRIYPVHVFVDGVRRVNEDMFNWQASGEGLKATPFDYTGMDLPSFARMLPEVSAQFFSLHFLVYDDSFPIFLRARQIPLARGYDTGWEFLPQDRPVTFSSQGERPQAL